MIRFAVTVTAVELALTLGAALFITFAETGEPFLSRGEFEMLGIPLERYSTHRQTRFGALFSYDTQVTVKGPGPAILVSLRVGTPRSEYDSRLQGERWAKAREGDEAPVVNDESWPEEPGYAVRHRGRNGVRAEVVRLHGKDMLIVRAIRMNVPPERAGEEVSACERMARIVQEYAAQKLGWR